MESNGDVPCYVVDASVATKWHLRDEEDTALADAVLTDFREGRIRLLAPDHIRYEVPSAIRNALRTRRLPMDEARPAIEEFLSWQIPTVSSDALTLAAFDLSVSFGCSLYDGLYLALAEHAGCPIVHADRRLRNALGDRFPQALWLDNYPAAS